MPKIDLPIEGVGRGRREVTLFLLIVIALVALGLAAYFYVRSVDLQNNPQQAAQAQVQALLDRVSKLIILPQGETPTVATVTDPEQLKSQPFFANAQVGDKVLIYTGAKKAILYDPTHNIIVDVAPVNIGGTNPSPAPQPVSTSTKKTGK